MGQRVKRAVGGDIRRYARRVVAFALPPTGFVLVLLLPTVQKIVLAEPSYIHVETSLPECPCPESTRWLVNVRGARSSSNCTPVNREGHVDDKKTEWSLAFRGKGDRPSNGELSIVASQSCNVNVRHVRESDRANMEIIEIEDGGTTIKLRDFKAGIDTMCQLRRGADCSSGMPCVEFRPDTPMSFDKQARWPFIVSGALVVVFIWVCQLTAVLVPGAPELSVDKPMIEVVRF